MIPFRVTKLTKTAKLPHRNCESDLWDLYANDFCIEHLKDRNETMFKSIEESHIDLAPMGRVLVKTGISLELPIQYSLSISRAKTLTKQWLYKKPNTPDIGFSNLEAYAVADIRPRSGLALKHGITVLNSPGTIDNSYRKEIGVILYNAGHEAYTITKGDKIAQMLIRPLYPSKMEEIETIEDTGRGGYGSTGK
jgi:dUTPase